MPPCGMTTRASGDVRVPVAVVGQDPHDRGVVDAGEHHGLVDEA